MRKFLLAGIGSLILGSAANAATIDVDNLFEGIGSQGAAGIQATSYVSPELTRSFVAFQTWTVGTSGRLDRIDLFGNAVHIWALDADSWNQDQEFNVKLTILGGSENGEPGTIELGSVIKPASELGVITKTTSFDLSGLGILASTGDILTLRMSVDECPAIYSCSKSWMNTSEIFGLGGTKELDGGAAYTMSSSGALFLAPKDMSFRTWMSAVPEPSTWALLIVGFGAVGSMVRGSRRRSVFSAA